MKNVICISCFDKKNIISAGQGYIFPPNGGSLSAACSPNKLAGVPFNTRDWLMMDITNGADFACAVLWEFMEQSDRSRIAFKMGLLPHLRTRIAIPATALDGNILFLPRTPGKLKTVTQGRPIKLENLDRFELSIPNAPGSVQLIIHDLYITDTEPDYPVEKKPMVDTLGQKLCSSWKGKTADETELRLFLQKEAGKNITHTPPGRSKYGGWTIKQFEPTGYFAVRHDGHRYWLADPDGYAFFSIGLDCVGIDGDCNLEGIEQLATDLPAKGCMGWSVQRGTSYSWHKANLKRVFGSSWYDEWVKITRRRLTEWGFNTIACWSDMNYAKKDDRPYVFIFGHYPNTKQSIFRNFPDVFSDEFKESAAEYAKQIITYKDDKNLIGYFLSNEPDWAFVNSLNIAAVLLESEYPYHSKTILAEFMRRRYDTLAALNNAWGTAFETFDSLLQPVQASSLTETAYNDLWDFSAEMIREYIKIPSIAIRRYDPNHLNLGIRYAWLSSKVLVSGSEYFDVFSFNCYSMDPKDSIENILNTIFEGDQLSRTIGKPLMIGEFHFGALDRGLDATGIRGVTTQEERGKAYRYYMHSAAAHPCCIGAHYFTLNDQGYLGRFDGENYQIGLVDVCNRPYDEFVSGIVKTNDELYEIADGSRQPAAEKADEITAVFF